MHVQRIDDLVQNEKHRRFTNRETELSLFEKLIYLTADSFRIIGIHGKGGVGKSELLAEFVRLTKKSGNPFILIEGYSQKNVLAILGTLRFLAGDYATPDNFSVFDRYYYLYARMQNKVQKDDDLIAEFKKAIDQRQSNQNLNIGGNFSQQDSSIAVLKDTFDPEDIKFYLKAENYLTEELINAFEKITPDKPWILLIDAYENLVELDNWIRDHLVLQLPQYFRVVIAGRRPYSQSWHELGPVFKSINLIAFGEEHTKEYFVKRGITDDALIAEIFRLTVGHPLFLGVLAGIKDKDPSLSSHDLDSDDKYLAMSSMARKIIESFKDPILKDAIKICSIFRFFDDKTLSYFWGDDADEILKKLLDEAFITRRSQGYAIHDLFWDYWNAEQKHHDPGKFRGVNQKAIYFYSEQIESAGREDWEKYIIEILYHKLAINPQEGLSFLLDAYNAAEAQYRLNICEALIREARGNENEQLRDWLIFLEARLAHGRDNWLLAREKLEGLLHNKLLANNELASYALAWLGRVYYRLGELKKAEKVYKGASIAYEENGRKVEYAQIQQQLCDIKIGQRKWADAKKYLQRCLAKFDEIEKSNLRVSSSHIDTTSIDRSKAWALNSLGTVYLEQGNFNAALEKYRESLEYFQRLEDQYGIARSQYRVGWVLQQTGNWEEAIECYRQSREILSSLDANYWIARVIVKLADTYRLIGELQKSEDIYLECMRICIMLKAPLGIPVVLDSLGRLYQDKGLLNKAEKMHLLSLNRKRRNSFLFEIELTLMNLGDLELKRKNLGSALIYYNESLGIMRSSKNHYGEAVLLIKLSEALLLSNSLEALDHNLVLAEKISTRNKYIDVRSRVFFIRGILHLQNKSYSGGAASFIKALENAKQFNKYYLANTIRELRALNLLGTIPENFPEKAVIDSYLREFPQ